MDRVSKGKRSEIMSKIKSVDTKCELSLLHALKKSGTKDFKRNYNIIGKPDFAFPKIKLAVFCDSDFWHGKKGVPEINQDYWRKKLLRNKMRDKLVNKELKKLGWIVIRIPETSILKDPISNALRIKNLIDSISNMPNS